MVIVIILEAITFMAIFFLLLIYLDVIYELYNAIMGSLSKITP
jgi:hypothetical protein